MDLHHNHKLNPPFLIGFCDHPSRNSWFSTTMTQACKRNHHLRYPFSSKPWFWGFGQPVLSNKPSRSAYPFQKPTNLNFWEHILHRVLRFDSNCPNVRLSFPDRRCGILQTQLGQTLCDTHGKVHPRFAWRSVGPPQVCLGVGGEGG